MLEVVVDRESASVLELEDQENHRPHYFLLGDVGHCELHPVLHSADFKRMAGLLVLKEHLLAGLDRLLVVGYEKIIIDLFIKVEIGKRVLVGRLILEYFLQFLYIEFADGIQVLIDLRDGDPLLFTERLTLSNALGESQLDGLVEVLLNYLTIEVPSACLTGMRGGMFIDYN